MASVAMLYCLILQREKSNGASLDCSERNQPLNLRAKIVNLRRAELDIAVQHGCLLHILCITNGRDGMIMRPQNYVVFLIPVEYPALLLDYIAV